MSDIDWSKRSAFDGYSSMADHDWGWKKRAVAPDNDDNNDDQDGASRGYYFNKRDLLSSYDPALWQRYYRPYSSYSAPSDDSSSSAPIALASRSYGTSYRPSTYRRSSITSPNNYNYVGMADLDWGWKKRKRFAIKRTSLTCTRLY